MDEVQLLPLPRASKYRSAPRPAQLVVSPTTPTTVSKPAQRNEQKEASCRRRLWGTAGDLRHPCRVSRRPSGSSSQHPVSRQVPAYGNRKRQSTYMHSPSRHPVFTAASTGATRRSRPSKVTNLASFRAGLPRPALPSSRTIVRPTLNRVSIGTAAYAEVARSLGLLALA